MTSCWRGSSTSKPGGIQTRRVNPPALAPFDGQFVLDLDERGRGVFGREAVVIADEVDRHRTAAQILAHLRFHLGANRRQGASGKSPCSRAVAGRA